MSRRTVISVCENIVYAHILNRVAQGVVSLISGFEYIKILALPSVKIYMQRLSLARRQLQLTSAFYCNAIEQ